MQLVMDVKNIATMGLPLLVSISALLMYKTLAHQKFWGKFTETLHHGRLDVSYVRLNGRLRNIMKLRIQSLF